VTPRQIAVIAAVAFGILSPILQALANVGLTQAEFSANGDQTLRAEGYAFSIWSLIYAGLIAFAFWQALPRHQVSAMLDRLGWTAVVAIVGTGAWIWAAALDVRWATVAIIVTSAAVLIGGLLTAQREGSGTIADWLLAWWPLGLLAGWLTIASALNILTVLTAEGLIGPDATLPAAGLGLLAVTLATLAVLKASRLVAFAVPVIWGLVAVWAAEKGDQPLIAPLALAAAVAIGLFAAWLARPVSKTAS
jgi:hypothetical protein